MLGGPNDAWWPQAHHSQAQKILGKCNTELHPEQQHAFCTSPRCCALATQTCERWIRRALGEHEPLGASVACPAGATTRAFSTGASLTTYVCASSAGNEQVKCCSTWFVQFRHHLSSRVRNNVFLIFRVKTEAWGHTKHMKAKGFKAYIVLQCKEYDIGSIDALSTTPSRT